MPLGRGDRCGSRGEAIISLEPSMVFNKNASSAQTSPGGECARFRYQPNLRCQDWLSKAGEAGSIVPRSPLVYPRCGVCQLKESARLPHRSTVGTALFSLGRMLP